MRVYSKKKKGFQTCHNIAFSVPCYVGQNSQEILDHLSRKSSVEQAT